MYWRSSYQAHRPEKASVKAAQARQQVAALLVADKRSTSQAERKARNNRLIQQSVLFDLAGLAHRSRGELLGLLLAASTTVDYQRWISWKSRGEAMLAQLKPTVGSKRARAKMAELEWT